MTAVKLKNEKVMISEEYKKFEEDQERIMWIANSRHQNMHADNTSNSDQNLQQLNPKDYEVNNSFERD